MRLTSVSFLFLAILFFACNNYEYPDSDIQVLKGATVFDGNGRVIENAIVIVEDGRIKSVGGSNVTLPVRASIIDVTGKFIMPGLVDAHVHFFQTAFFDSRPDAGDVRDSISYIEVQAFQRANPDRYYEAYLRSGITAVYDVGGFNWSVDLQRTAENDLNATHVAAAGVLITPASEQQIATFNTPNEDVMRHLATEEIGRKVVQENSLNGSTGIKIWAMSPNDPDFVKKIEGVADETVLQGNKLIVHATALDQAKLALRLNAKLLVHSVENEEVDDEFITLIKENEAVYTPTLIVSRGYYNTYRAINGDPFVIKDPNQVVDQKTKDLLTNAAAFQRFFDSEQLEERIERFETILEQRDKMMATNLKKLYDAGALIAVGTDAGNPGTLHGISIYDEIEAMQKTGIPASDLIVMATKNGAIAMDRLGDFGTLESGKMADLIVLSKDPSTDISNTRSITHVMRGGLLRKVNEAFQ
ncbi:MAG: amidohydrolase family protein [Cyclobacteriaceae bacterium]